MTMPSPPSAPIKRLCIFSDGSWSDAEKEVGTNIFTMAKAVKHTCKEMIPQLVFYDAGVGTGGSVSDAIKGGAFGEGIDRNIQELYWFLALNYTAGDEVYMFGYSRGAYTVRSLAGMIEHAGLVGRDHVDFVKEAYELYRSGVGSESDAARAFRAAHGERIAIKVVGCFDTVGALGLPEDLPWGLGLGRDRSKYEFHDTRLGALVEHGIHALSIDETKRVYQPTRMQAHARARAGQVTEKFLPGHHGGIGGGSRAELGLGRNALRFMLDELRRRGAPLAIDEARLGRARDIYAPPVARDSLADAALRLVTGSRVREVGGVEWLHESAVRRWVRVEQWRPDALRGMEEAIRDAGRALGAS